MSMVQAPNLTQVGAAVDAVSEEMAQPGEQLMDGLDDEAGTTAILDIGRVHRGTDQQTGSRFGTRRP